VANVSVLLVDSAGSLQQVQDADVLLAAGLDRRASSGNLTIGAGVDGASEDIIIGGALAATGEILLGSVASQVRVLGDLDVDGALSDDLDVGNFDLLNVKTATFTLQTQSGVTGAITVNWTNGQKHKVVFGAGNITFSFTTPAETGNFILELTQDATGGRTVTWPATVRWTNDIEPTLTTTGSRTDLFSFWWNGTYYLGMMAPNFDLS